MTYALRSWAAANPAKIYGVAHFGKSLLWSCSVLYFAFYLTEVAQLPPATMGALLSASLVINAAADVVVGHAITWHVRDHGAAARFQVQGALVAAIAFACFALTGLLSERWRLAYGAVSLLGFRLGYSLLDVPQNSFMAFWAKTDAQRADLAGSRYVASGASNLVVSLLVSALVQVGPRAHQEACFLAIAGCFGAMAVLGSLALLLLNGVEAPGVDARAGSTRGAQEPAPGFAYGTVLGAILIFSTLSPGFTRLEGYFSAFALKGESIAFLFMPLIAIGQMIGQALWLTISRKRALATVLMMAATSWTVAAVIFWLGGIFYRASLPIVALLYGMTWSGVSMAIWSLLAKATATRPDLVTRRFGYFTFVSKLSQSISYLLIGALLSLIAYHSAGPVGAEVISAMAIGPVMAGSLIVLLSLLRFNRRKGQRLLDVATGDSA